MSDVTDLGRKLDRTSYDIAKSLVKLDELCKLRASVKEPLPLDSAIAETQKYLADLHILIGQIERLDVLQDVPEAKATPLQTS